MSVMAAKCGEPEVEQEGGKERYVNVKGTNKV